MSHSMVLLAEAVQDKKLRQRQTNSAARQTYLARSIP
jgi:hypothetical protein